MSSIKHLQYNQYVIIVKEDRRGDSVKHKLLPFIANCVYLTSKINPDLLDTKLVKVFRNAFLNEQLGHQVPN
jgi:hypothetical protein